MPRNSKEYKEGERHYLSGKEYSNPYSRGSNEYNEFERGWSQALKRNPGLTERYHAQRIKARRLEQERNKAVLDEKKRAYKKASGR